MNKETQVAISIKDVSDLMDADSALEMWLENVRAIIRSGRPVASAIAEADLLFAHARNRYALWAVESPPIEEEEDEEG
jgi:hypothetical protein